LQWLLTHCNTRWLQCIDQSQLDFAVRFCPTTTGEDAPLFEETLLPEDNPGNYPIDTQLTVEWEPWLKVMGTHKVRVKNTLRFTCYADSISAAVAVQGVAIGRFPLLDDLLRDKRLTAHFKGAAASQRGYYLAMGKRAINPNAQDFASWLREKAKWV
jgi:LysR family transcriptional regulator, glycine cleavage system transcriptional activator